MVESGRFFNQSDYDRKMGVPEELCGQLSEEAQMARFFALTEQGVPEDEARRNLGLTNDEHYSYNDNNLTIGE